MIIVYPKYFVMPVIMDDDFELNYLSSKREEKEVNLQTEEKGEFDDIDNGFVKAEIQG